MGLFSYSYSQKFPIISKIDPREEESELLNRQQLLAQKIGD